MKTYTDRYGLVHRAFIATPPSAAKWTIYCEWNAYRDAHLVRDRIEHYVKRVVTCMQCALCESL